MFRKYSNVSARRGFGIPAAKIEWELNSLLGASILVPLFQNFDFGTQLAEKFPLRTEWYFDSLRAEETKFLLQVRCQIEIWQRERE